MSCDYNKPNCPCGTKTSSSCVIYEGTRGLCDPSIRESTVECEIENIYNNICKLKEYTDVSNFRASCDGSGQSLNISDNLELIKEDLCNLKEVIKKSEQEFLDCGLFYGTLLDTCNGEAEPKTRCEFYQLLINKLIKLSDISNGK